MVDIGKLDPKLAAQHFGNPQGEIGLALANSMSSRNTAVYEAAARRLGMKPGERLFEVGFGNGKLVPLLLTSAPELTYAGIDISETMVAEAEDFNRELVETGKAVFRLASVDSIPFADGSFDRALSVNTIYFWSDPVRSLTELRRVLRPDGVLLVAAGTPRTMAKLPPAQHGFRVYDDAQLLELHRQAGFGSVEVERYSDTATGPDGSLVDREGYFVVSIT